MRFDSLNDTVNWVKENINIHNTQLPTSILGLIKGCSQESVSDKFLTFGMIVYAVITGLYKNGDNITKDKLANDEASLYVSRLFLSFVLEKLRRLRIIKFEPVNIFFVKEIEKKEISIIGDQNFIEDELKGKTFSYKEFVNVFW